MARWRVVQASYDAASAGKLWEACVEFVNLDEGERPETLKRTTSVPHLAS